MNKQIEFSFEEPYRFTASCKNGRRSRARWWFDQMRQVVNRAFDRRPVTAARPEQGYLFMSR
jgi:hypothetical protein